MSYDEYKKAKATGFYNANRIRQFCDEAIERIKKARIKKWEDAIENHIEYRKSFKNHWYGFLFKIPTKKQTIIYLSNDYTYDSTFINCMNSWDIDVKSIKKLINLCDTCESHYINIDMDFASLLKKWGFKESDKKIDGI